MTMTAPDQARHQPGQETPPTCYRHPGRETWVSCVRCGRHACPDCLRSGGGRAAVRGVRARRGARDRQAGEDRLRRAARAHRRGHLDPGRHQRRAVPRRAGQAEHRQRLGAARLRAVQPTGGPVQGIAAGQWYRLITSAFLPPATGLGGLGFLDIVFNMWALYRGRAEPGAAARPGPVPRRLPAQRARRRGGLLPHRPALRAGARRQRRDLRPVRRLVRGRKALRSTAAGSSC